MTLQERLNQGKYEPFGGWAKFAEIMNLDLNYEGKAMEIAKCFRVSVATGRDWMRLYKKTQLDGITR